MKLVIFAYPLHYHICQLALRYAVTALNNIDSVVIIWDDLARPRLEQELNLGQQLAQATDTEIIKTSNLPILHDQRHGWIRQQLVKLHLHQLLPGDTWAVLDGDTVLRCTRDLHRTIHNNPYDYYAPAHEFMYHAMGLRRGEHPSYMSPVWQAERAVLEALHEHVRTRHHAEFIQVYDQFTQKNYPHAPWPPLNEIELYANFAVQVLNYQFNLIDSTALTVPAEDFLSAWATEEDIILAGRDRMPELFWQEQNIAYNHQLNNWLNHYG